MIAVDRQREMIVKPLLVRAIVSPELVCDTRVDIAAAMRAAGASFVHAAVERLDPASGIAILSDGRRIPFDYAVLATGREPDWQHVPGLVRRFGGVCDDFLARHSGYSNKEWRGGEYLFLAAPLVGSELQPLDHPLYESALLLDAHLRREGLRKRTQISIVTPRTAVWSDAGSRVQRLMADIFAQRGIRVFTRARPVQVVDRVLQVDLPSGRGEIPFDRLVAIPPFRGSTLATKSGLADASGWVAADDRQRHPGHPNVYVIGDISARSVPKTGHSAMVSARVAMQDLVARHMGRTPPPLPAPIVLAITELGQGRAMFVRDDTVFGGHIEQAWTGRLPYWGKSAFLQTFRWLRGNLPIMP